MRSGAFCVLLSAGVCTGNVPGKNARVDEKMHLQTTTYDENG